MSDHDSPGDEKKSPKNRSKVVSSEKRDPNEALEYWTKEKIESAKPIPFPKPEVTESKSQDNDNDGD